MTQSKVLAELQELNLNYLLLVQKLVTEDRDAAIFRLKIDEDLADLIAEMSVKDLTLLARQPQSWLRPCVDATNTLKEILSNSRASSMRETHLAMLMASASA
ncbi:flagellar transcriptional regulator FlhD [Pseudidiomarina homiensis]|uniref:flagellar transcriptional regulator FlhD n=1 Tax=Pseudidiomarina homiensis TaxID=364198 RepID=UPI00215A5E58|nr:flagellar transcriptional regulator FlhD [Pseudidiomarina homiensis]